jgi:hypothetical protein
MKRILYPLLGLAATVAVAVSPALASSSRSTKTTLTAFLTVNQSIPTPKGASGSGKFTAIVAGKTIRWRMTFTGMTGPVAASHIHSALAGRANPAPAATLCAPCKSSQSGAVTVSAAVLKRILGGATYVNLHTAQNPAGEIRGQIASR